MKRRAVLGVPRELALPECLRAGRCIEVWSPERLDPWMAFRAYSLAENRWLELHGLTWRDGAAIPARLHRGSGPWSFAFLERTNPEHLAERLLGFGLPVHWRPEPAPAEWRDIPESTPARCRSTRPSPALRRAVSHERTGSQWGH